MKVTVNKSNPLKPVSYKDLVTGDFFLFVECYKASSNEVFESDISLKLNTGYIKMYEASERPDPPMPDFLFDKVYRVRAELVVTHHL